MDSRFRFFLPSLDALFPSVYMKEREKNDRNLVPTTKYSSLLNNLSALLIWTFAFNTTVQFLNQMSFNFIIKYMEEQYAHPIGCCCLWKTWLSLPFPRSIVFVKMLTRFLVPKIVLTIKIFLDNVKVSNYFNECTFFNFFYSFLNIIKRTIYFPLTWPIVLD